MLTYSETSVKDGELPSRFSKCYHTGKEIFKLLLATGPDRAGDQLPGLHQWRRSLDTVICWAYGENWRNMPGSARGSGARSDYIQRVGLWECLWWGQTVKSLGRTQPLIGSRSRIMSSSNDHLSRRLVAVDRSIRKPPSCCVYHTRLLSHLPATPQPTPGWGTHTGPSWSCVSSPERWPGQCWSKTEGSHTACQSNYFFKHS